ncbi:MAG TPA: DUF4197 domain-containing protein [Chitinophagaceae bacterium]|nr:DUF4197 domain-containing protein [Chitinophagaceae bacterium]
MKKIFSVVLLAAFMPILFSCSATRFGGYNLTEKDAAAAIRQLLETGTRDGVTGAFSKDAVLSTLFPEPVKKALNTLQQLGLTNEVDRFTTTLSTAAEKSAQQSIPVFVNAIQTMPLTDAMRIVKSGGTAATDYLRSTSGASLRTSITPVMQTALDEYKLNEQWDRIIKPVKGIAGGKLNIDLATLMAGMVSEKMFQKIEQREQQLRTDAAARNTVLLQKVFSKNWN